jgi:UTP-glucose-1-phosphate uridylyltransferase
MTKSDIENIFDSSFDDAIERIEEGNHQEYQIVDLMKKLATADERVYLATEDLDMYDLLNGRYNAVQEPFIAKMYEGWNAELSALRGKDWRLFGWQ